MAVTTKYSLMEEVRQLVAGGDPSAGAKFEPRMVMTFLQQVINKKLKTEYFTVTLPGDETIPENLVLASYSNIAVQKYKGRSRAKLPAMPVSLRRGMGIFFVGPAVSNLYLATPTLTLVSATPYQINISWVTIPNATSYFVERSTDAGFVAGLTSIYTGSGISFTDALVSPSTPYYYRITAIATGYRNSDYGYANITSLPITVLQLFDNTFNYTFN